MEHTLSILFLYAIPSAVCLIAILLLLLGLPKQFSPDNQSSVVFINTLASIATIVSISIAIGTYYLAENRAHEEKVAIARNQVINALTEIKKNKDICNKFKKEKDWYVSARQFPFWKLSTLALEQLIRNSNFPPTTYNRIIELHSMSIQYNSILEIIRNPALLPSPEWGQFQRGMLNLLEEKSELMNMGYTEVQKELSTLAYTKNR